MTTSTSSSTTSTTTTTTTMALAAAAASAAGGVWTRYRPFPIFSSSVSVSMSPLSLGTALLLLLTLQVTGLGGSCPPDVSDQTTACFSDYNREFQNIRHSPKRLCCGVDVETLRAFCSSFVRAMDCVKPLRKRCPRSGAVDESVDRNLFGATDSLDELCSDDTLIEKYALFQTCITRTGPTTEKCFQHYLNSSDTIHLMTTVDTRHIAEFCTNMRGTLQCIQKHVRQSCGSDASSLVVKLVKPMVRQSNKCNYNVVTSSPVSQGQPSPSSQDGGSYDPSNAAPRTALSSLPLPALLLLVMCVGLVARTWPLQGSAS